MSLEPLLSLNEIAGVNEMHFLPSFIFAVQILIEYVPIFLNDPGFPWRSFHILLVVPLNR